MTNEKVILNEFTIEPAKILGAGDAENLDFSKNLGDNSPDSQNNNEVGQKKQYEQGKGDDKSKKHYYVIQRTSVGINQNKKEKYVFKGGIEKFVDKITRKYAGESKKAISKKSGKKGSKTSTQKEETLDNKSSTGESGISGAVGVSSGPSISIGPSLSSGGTASLSGGFPTSSQVEQRNATIKKKGEKNKKGKKKDKHTDSVDTRASSSATESTTSSGQKEKPGAKKSLKKGKLSKKVLFVERKLSPIPEFKTGLEVLEWVKKRYHVHIFSSESSEEEEISTIVIERKKKKKPKRRESSKDTMESEKGKETGKGKKKGKPKEKGKKEKPKGGKGKKGKGKKGKVKKGKGEREMETRIPRPEGLEDYVMKLIRLAKTKLKIEAKKDTSKKKKGKKGKGGKKKGGGGGGKKKGGRKKKDKGEKKGKKEKKEKKAPKFVIQKPPKPPTAKELRERKQMEMLKKKNEIQDLTNDEKRKIHEQAKRMEGLKVCLKKIKKIKNFIREIYIQKSRAQYWQQYLECSNLPIVRNIPILSMYLRMWKNEINETTPQEAVTKTRDVLEILKMIEDYTEHKRSKKPRRYENFLWIRQRFRKYLYVMLSKMTYNLLSDCQTNMNHIDLYHGDFALRDKHITVCIWLKFQAPIPYPNPRKQVPSPISLDFKQMKTEILFPPSIDGHKMAFRGVYLSFDYLSDLSPNSVKPPKPTYYSYNLRFLMDREWRIKRRYKFYGKYRSQYEKEIQTRENAIQEKSGPPGPLTAAMKKKPPPIKIQPMKKFHLPRIKLYGNIPNVTPQRLKPTAEEYAEALEAVLFHRMKKQLCYNSSRYEINLRKFVILGGIHMINVFYQPPQPQDQVTRELNVSEFILPRKLEKIEFHEKFKIARMKKKTPEEIEEALRSQEKGLLKLIQVTITIPPQVMFFEPPIVCLWDSKLKKWSKKDIHHVKQNEEKGTVTFRLGRCGSIGLAALRYGNLPFQAWDIRPGKGGRIIVQLTAAMLMFEFQVKGIHIKVLQLQNAPNKCLDHIISKKFQLHHLAKILKDAGADIFPDFDAFCYLQGYKEKHWPTEYMCYYNMAQMAVCYNFSWSRWNVARSYRSIVMQMRLYDKNIKISKRPHLVLVTPLKATYIKCKEVSPVFSSRPKKNIKFSCNLYYLMRHTTNPYVRNKIVDFRKDTVYTLAKLLMRTRLLSFS